MGAYYPHQSVTESQQHSTPPLGTPLALVLLVLNRYAWTLLRPLRRRRLLLPYGGRRGFIPLLS